MPAEEVRAFREAAAEASIEILEVKPGLDITVAIRERRNRGVRLFIAAGGDGTVSHVMQPLVHSDAIFAVIPFGTYNHFARDLGIPLEWREALAVALTGETVPVDTARVNERFFVNNVSLGLYPELVMKREERGRDYPRWKARLYAFWVTLKKYPHVTFTIESEHHHDVVHTHMFMVSNNSYDLSRIGIEAPRSRMTEGRLSVYWTPRLSRYALMKFAAHFLAGRVHDAPGFRSFRTQQVRIQSRRGALKLGLDGEVFEMKTPLVMTMVPQSLSVRVPREAADAV
jgi:diacylglycerol kinase family enzyme